MGFQPMPSTLKPMASHDFRNPGSERSEHSHISGFAERRMPRAASLDF
jgi:hypothetical protein